MPYLNIRLAAEPSQGTAEKISSILLKHTTELLGKNPDVTAVAVDFISPELWFVGGKRVKDLHVATFSLDIKVTEGTNTKIEKAAYCKKVFADIESITGPVSPASYIVIQDVRADSWGFQGKTQEFRFIQSLSL